MEQQKLLDAFIARTGDAQVGKALFGKIKSEARQEYPLREAAAAHRALESRVTTGATVLLP